jgi:hypothetical protein
MWFLNSAGVERLLSSGLPTPPGLDTHTGRLFDEDAWLRRALGSRLPSLGALGADLARLGVTGVTDMNPTNGDTDRAGAQSDSPLPARNVETCPGAAVMGL